MSMRRVAAFGAAGLLVLGGCGSLTETEDEGFTLPAEQAKWVAEFVAGVGTHGVNSGGAGQAPAAGVAPQQVLVNQSVDYRHTCNQGGNIHVLGSITGSISDSGSGLLSLGITETLSDCRSRTTSGGWFELTGDPYLSLTGTFSFLNGVPATQQSMSMGGAFRWRFDTGQSGGCAIQLSILFNSTTGGGTVSGTVCGYPVSGSVS